jgi:hypothetical protein
MTAAERGAMNKKEAEPAQGGQYGPDFRSYTKQVICHEASPILTALPKEKPAPVLQ